MKICLIIHLEAAHLSEIHDNDMITIESIFSFYIIRPFLQTVFSLVLGNW